VSLLVVGVSYRTAPVELLERLSVPAKEIPGLLTTLLGTPYVREAMVLSTCNRVEVYAEVSAFHGALTDIGSLLAARVGGDLNTLAEHLYMHYDTDAVRHAFSVAAGLDSMVIGEAQILGQLREAYTVARDTDSCGRTLHELAQQALRVGKRVHTETDIDRAGQSVVSAALELGAERFGLAGADGMDFTGTSALVVGAGGMGALAVVTLRRAGVADLTVTNRSFERARRLAASHGATAVPFDQMDEVLATADVVVCATASPGHVLTAERVARAVTGDRRMLIVDLAVPRDVAPDVAELAGVTLVDLERLGAALRAATTDEDVRAAEAIVTEEVTAFQAWLRGTEVAPTVAALRARADDVVSTELRRLAQRRPELTDEQRAEVARTVHRVVQRLLHQPTVRVRQLASEPGGARYAAALRELFGLDTVTASASEALSVSAENVETVDVLHQPDRSESGSPPRTDEEAVS